MSIEDRHWYKEDFDRRMGRGSARDNAEQKQSEEAAQRSTKPRQPEKRRASPERVKKYEPTNGEKYAYNNTPPAHTMLAAKYELAIRKRTQKTFWAGFTIGVIAASVATILILPLV